VCVCVRKEDGGRDTDKERETVCAFVWVCLGRCVCLCLCPLSHARVCACVGTREHARACKHVSDSGEEIESEREKPIYTHP